ncbi:MAG TPA: cell envelope integrity protein TolA [Steroidobacteraceae bacterium]|nr:cell envelope integrity protein TolA [Steroidobacteraceae bacterium]
MIERASDRWVSIVLSVLLHGTLVAALVYGFWTYRQSRPPTPTLAIEATVVDSRSVNGAALKTPPAPEPPAPEPTPAPPQPEPVEPTGPPQPTPEELAQREEALKEQAQKEQTQKAQTEKERADKEQAERQAADKQHQVEEQKQQEEAQRQAEEKRQALQKQREAQEKADAERKALEIKRRAEEQRVAEQKAAAAQREAEDKSRAESEAELRTSLAAEEHANQLRSSGALVSWLSQITARIQHAWLRPPSARSGIQCVLHITQAPGGAVLSARIESCNGDQAVRESIEAAAYRASPLPPPPDPSMFERDLEVTFRPD